MKNKNILFKKSFIVYNQISEFVEKMKGEQNGEF